jgi:hypothetical protein
MPITFSFRPTPAFSSTQPNDEQSGTKLMQRLLALNSAWAPAFYEHFCALLYLPVKP